jgi:hypothetical protein
LGTWTESLLMQQFKGFSMCLRQHCYVHQQMVCSVTKRRVAVDIQQPCRKRCASLAAKLVLSDMPTSFSDTINVSCCKCCRCQLWLNTMPQTTDHNAARLTQRSACPRSHSAASCYCAAARVDASSAANVDTYSSTATGREPSRLNQRLGHAHVKCNHIASSSLLQVSTLAALAYHKATGRQATHHKQRLDFIHAQVQLLFTAACCFRCRP